MAISIANCARDLKKDTLIVDPAQTSDDILHLFHEQAALEIVPVVESGLPIGLINRHQFMNEMARPYMREVYGRKSCIAFMDKQPLIVDERLPIQELSFQALAAGQKALTDGFIITQNGQYIGIGLGIDLVDAVTKLQAEKNRIVMESIDYASVIQKSFLRPSLRDLETSFSDHLLYWEPRDVVGGDFFVFRPIDEGYFIAIIDCTGHGVPGAFMTLIMASLLERLLQHGNPRDPASIMGELNRMAKQTLAQESIDGASNQSDDGMDAAFLWYDPSNRALTWTSAKTPLYVLSRHAEGTPNIEQLNGDRTGVGYRTTAMQHVWHNHQIQLTAGTSVFISTDGLIDQPGGVKRIAFGKKRLKNALLEQPDAPLNGQGERIMQTFRAYQGEQIRRDDVTFFGFRA